MISKRGSELATGELYSFLKLRTDVFYLEQHVDDEELDNRDLESTTIHYWIVDDVGTAAYLRVLHDEVTEHRGAHRVPGRVVVRADRRGQGLAQLLFAVVVADFGRQPMLLHAQEYIAPLYSRFGFVAFGDVYQEAGIPHISMFREADTLTG